MMLDAPLLVVILHIRLVVSERVTVKMNPNEVIQQCKEILSQRYQNQFKGLVLYGSMAREQATSSSDIDLLVLLTPPFDYFQELHNIVNMLYPLQLESQHLISAKPASEPDYEQGHHRLYRQVKKEGVMV